MSGEHDEAEAAPTIWDALRDWSSTLPPWARYLVATAANRGRIADTEIETAYAVFLAGNALNETGEAPEIDPPGFAGRVASAERESLTLLSISGIRGVNALPTNAGITFGPALTVIYGRNGAGKSGFGRLLGNACFSRQRSPILPDIYAEETPRKPAANFEVRLGDGEPTTISFSDPDELTPLKRLTVFDTTVAGHHISQASPFEFKPVGFDVFPEVSRAFGDLSKRLDAEISRRTRENKFPESFLGGGTPTVVHDAVNHLGPDSDLEMLRALGMYGANESARLTELDAQLQALRSKSPKDLLRSLGQAVADVTTLKNKLTALGHEFQVDAVAARVNRIRDARAKEGAAKALGSDQFRRPFFRAVGTPQWEEFAASVHALAAQEAGSYPQDNDRCLLCERPFDTGSREHVQALLKFVESDARREAASALSLVEEEARRLRGLDLTAFARATRVYDHVAKLSADCAEDVEATFARLVAARDVATMDASEQTELATAVSVDASVSKLASLEEQIRQDIVRLASDDIDASIASLELERRVLRHRHVLSQQLPQIEAFVADAQWVRNATRARTSLNTRSITEKEKEFFGSFVGDGYRRRLASECSKLDCTVPIELQTVGRSGQTIRNLVLPGGHRPETVLSEGEQRAVALADFLTEVSQNPGAAGVVFDDPVTSQDHQRKRLIANRLVEEARCRQVVVFTHDLVFLNELVEAAKEIDVDVAGHWVDRDVEGRPGKVALDDYPSTSRVHETTQRAKSALARAKLLSGSELEDEIRKGMGALRRTLEETVVRHLFKKVVPRWTDRVIVTALPKVNWDVQKVGEIVALYEDLSRYIDGHSHTDEAMGATPQLAELEHRIQLVDELIKWTKADRKP
jgi:hypothetical protein